MTSNYKGNIAFIPLKTFSRRMPHKNFTEIEGKAIFNFVVQAALDTKLFDEVILSTDNSRLVVSLLEISDPSIKILQRSERSSNFDLPIKEVMYSQLSKMREIEKICLIYATSALLTANKIQSAYNKLTDEFKSVMGVSKLYPHPFRAFSVENGKMEKLLDPMLSDSHKWKEYYASNGSICWVKFDDFVAEKGFYLQPMAIEEFSPLEHVDIDQPADFTLLQELIQLNRIHP